MIPTVWSKVQSLWHTASSVLHHGRDVHLTWVKLSIETLSNKSLRVLEYKGKV